MAIVGYVKPGFRQESFTCPHCNCFSEHHWRYIQVNNSFESDTTATTSWCLRCRQYFFWQEQRLVWPLKSGIPDPIDGCPEQIKQVYNEARAIFTHSPRASSALLRLAIGAFLGGFEGHSFVNCHGVQVSIDGPRNQFDGELAALRSRREMESLSTSPVSSVLSEIADVAGEFGVPSAGLFAKALKSGETPVEKVVEQIENGAYVEISRIWKHLEGKDAQLKEFGERLESQEAHSAYVAAVLHGLRTSDPKKQSRIGALTVNCVYTKDLNPESFDDMMRAAVELKDK